MVSIKTVDKKQLLILTVSYAVFYALLVFMQAVTHKEIMYDISAISLGIFILAAGLLENRVVTIVFTCLTAVLTFILFFPLKQINFPILLAAYIVYAVFFLFADFMYGYMLKTRIKEEELAGQKQALDEIKSGKIEPAKIDADELDKEIKDITSLYAAAKDLSASLRMEEAIIMISQIIRKIFKNFKITLDELAYVLIVKKEHEFVIADAHGYDEEIIKENNKALVSFVLKNTPRTADLLYHPAISSDERLATFAFIKSVLYIPFYVEKKLLGVLFIAGRKENIFDEKQVEKMKILASYIAISLEKAYLYDEVEQMSITDSLTGLYVHRYFQEKMENEIKRAARSGQSMSLIMTDIDFFKKVNDTYGHLAGDFILKTLAMIMKNNTTPIDTVARYGGEEFVIIMPDTDKEKAHIRAVKIRKEVEKYNFKFNENYIKCTVSMGVATYPGDAITRRALIEKADKALYKAKEEGRNRVVKA